MKKNFGLFSRQLCLFTALACLSFSARSQGWPPTAATYSDIDPTGVATVTNNQRINMDMFGCYNATASQLRPDRNLVVYTFDDATSPSRVRLVVWEAGGGAPLTFTINNATQPDVVLLDDPGGIAGTDFIAALVYVSGGNIYLQYYNIGGVGSGSLTATGSTLGPDIISTGGLSDNPHIDAAPSHTQVFTASSYPLTLNKFYRYAITWHENNLGTDNILATFDDDFQGNATLNGPKVLLPSIIDNGIESDVAFTTVWDHNFSPAHEYHKAYYIYNDANTDIYDANIEDVYSVYGSPIVTINPIPVETGTVLSPPRIDAGNVQDLVVPNTIIWQGVVSMQNTTIPFNPEIHSYYQQVSGIQSMINYSSTVAGLSSYDVYNPVVTTASNSQGWTGGAAFAGNVDYLMGFYAADYLNGNADYVALAQDGWINLNTKMGFDKVNLIPWSGSTIPTPAMALTYGTNTGWAHTAAFCDGSTVYVKKPKDYAGGTPPSPLFKTTDIVKMDIPNELAVYPNPATTSICLTGLEGDFSYTITDMLGRQYTHGSMGTTVKTIDISSYPAGVYMVSVTQNNETKNLKFIKE